MDNLEVKSGSGDQFWSLFGGPVGRRMARWRMVFQGITELESQFSDLTDTQLKKESLSLRFRAKSGEKLDRLLPAAAALVRVAAQRTLQMRHYDVQLIGGMALFHGSIAEMDTGEGKTLTATLPLYMHALTGKGSHLATVNDYLARRDKEL
ncbi:MAG: preprotein translocase subunit SecA, partial [Planctomycetaceae bacterium]|nr:preprotein translocase subunit SecA [Planctomycetaceae bacterium]